MSFRTVVAHLLYTQTGAHNKRKQEKKKKNTKKKKTKTKESEETKTIIVYFCCALTREWHTIHQATSLLSNYILTTLTAALMDVDLLLYSSRRREEMRGVRVSTSFSHPHGGGFKIHIAQASSEASRRWMRGEVTDVLNRFSCPGRIAAHCCCCCCHLEGVGSRRYIYDTIIILFDDDDETAYCAST